MAMREVCVVYMWEVCVVSKSFGENKTASTVVMPQQSIFKHN